MTPSSLALAVSTLLDPERLSGAVGEARVATRVRIKPGVSVSASLADSSGAPAGRPGPPPGRASAGKVPA